MKFQYQTIIPSTNNIIRRSNLKSICDIILKENGILETEEYDPYDQCIIIQDNYDENEDNDDNYVRFFFILFVFFITFNLIDIDIFKPMAL